MAERSARNTVLVLRLILVALALLAVVLGLGWGRLRDTEGFLTGGVSLVLSVAVALAVVAATIATRFQRAGIWAALAAIGQASVLQLIVAGPFVRYQHLGLNGSWAPVGVLVVQAIAVGWGGRDFWPRAAVWVRSRMGLLVLGIAALTYMGVSSALSKSLAIYVGEVLLTTAVQVVSVANVILIVRSLPGVAMERVGSWTERMLGGGGDPAGPGGIDRVALGSAVWVTVLAALLNVLVYERHPHIPDEVSYLWQARYFARGWLAMPLPPVPEAFNLDLMTYEASRWYSPFPPGWPAFLAIGDWLGVPWLVNPILSGISLLLAFAFLRELYPVRTARLSVLLLAVSPWFVFMGMSFMAHTFTLAAALAAGLCVARSRRTGRFSLALLGGAAAGLVSLARPLDGLLVGGLLGVWLLLCRPFGRRAVNAAWFAFGAALVGAVALPYNRALTGDPGRHPVMDYFDRQYGAGVNDLGFGSNRGVGWTGLDPFPGHGLKDVLVNAQLNASLVDVDLLGWSTGSLILLLFLVASTRSWRSSDRLLVIALLGVIAIQSLYWFSGGPDLGARYWYLMIVPCIALSVRGLEALGASLDATASVRGRSALPHVMAGASVLCVLAMVNFFPWRAIDKYYHYRSMRPDIRTLSRKYGFENALVLVRGKRHPDYASAATYNPLEWTGTAPLYVWDRGEQVRARLLEAYRGRRVWIVNGPTVTGRGYEVVAGPLGPGITAAELTATLAADESAEAGK